MINAISPPGTKGIRWVLVGKWGTFYRRSASKWYSNWGRCNTCSYSTGLYSHWAMPPIAKVGETDVEKHTKWEGSCHHFGGCGGCHVSNSGWNVLSGINCQDGNHHGGCVCGPRKFARQSRQLALIAFNCVAAPNVGTPAEAEADPNPRSTSC